MTTSNPYQAPASDVSQTQSQQTYQPKVLATNGRIGRLRYLAYSMLGYLLLIPIAGLVGFMAAAGGEDGGGSVMASIIGLVMFVTYIAVIVYYFIVAKRRFNDMNKSGWMSLLMLIPLVNIFIGLWLVFGAGDAEPNQYGAAPCPNPLWVKILGLTMPFVAVIGILAAVAIPAYSDYVERAKQAQAELQSQ